MPPDITTGSASGNAKWTVMVFMGAATIEGNVSLLEAAEADLAEMRFVGSGPVEKGFGRPGDELNVFVQVHQGGDIVPRRGRITENMVGGIQALDEVQADQRDTRRGAALGHFIRTSLESAYHNRLNPEHYSLLVLWGHAYDFAIGRTPTTDGMIDALDFAELARVLELLQLQFGADAKLDILGFDACDGVSARAVRQIPPRLADRRSAAWLAVRPNPRSPSKAVWPPHGRLGVRVLHRAAILRIVRRGIRDGVPDAARSESSRRAHGSSGRSRRDAHGGHP